MSITTASGQFRPRARGVYVNSNVAALGAQDEFRVRPNTNRKQPSATITRYKQFSIITNGVEKLYPVSVTLSINATASSSLTSVQIMQMISDLAAAATVDNITTLMQGGVDLTTASSSTQSF